jgi:hypothetical protein
MIDLFRWRTGVLAGSIYVTDLDSEGGVCGTVT